MWYRKVTSDPNDLSPVVDALDHFEEVYQEGRATLEVDQKVVVKVASQLPGLVEYYFAQWKEICAIYEYLELRGDKAHAEAKRRFMESYPKAISERAADNYALTDEEVQAIRMVAIEVKLMREKFAGLSKGFEYLHYQLTNIRALRVAQMEDSII